MLFYSLDLGPVVECDDEYWLDTDMKPVFEQPQDVPSKVAYWNAMVRLQQILTYATRTIVSSTHGHLELQSSVNRPACAVLDQQI